MTRPENLVFVLKVGHEMRVRGYGLIEAWAYVGLDHPSLGLPSISILTISGRTGLEKDAGQPTQHALPPNAKPPGKRLSQPLPIRLRSRLVFGGSSLWPQPVEVAGSSVETNLMSAVVRSRSAK